MVVGMGVGREIDQIGSTGRLFEDEVAHFNTVLNPVIPHVNGLATFNFGGTIGDATSW